MNTRILELTELRKIRIGSSDKRHDEVKIEFLALAGHFLRQQSDDELGKPDLDWISLDLDQTHNLELSTRASNYIFTINDDSRTLHSEFSD